MKLVHIYAYQNMEILLGHPVYVAFLQNFISNFLEISQNFYLIPRFPQNLPYIFLQSP